MISSLLPSHLLGFILSRLPAADFIRSGAVCKSWRQITVENPHSAEIPFPQIPYLVLSGAKTGNLFSPVDHKISDMPQIHGKKFIGSYDSWLVYIDEVAELHILNPFTGATASLPSITTLDPIKGIVRDPLDGRIRGYWITGYMITGHGQRNLGLEFIRDDYFSKVIYFPSVSVTVAIHHSFLGLLAFARLGDDSWTELHLGLDPVDDVIFHKGLLLAVCSSGIVFAYDLSPSSPPVVRRPVGPETRFPKHYKHYLVESLDGDLLHVCKDTDPDTTNPFKIFTHERVPVTSLGAKTALFLGHNHSISLSTRDTPLKGNCIYLTDDYYYENLGVFDLDDGSITPLFPSGSTPAQLTCPPPIWMKDKALEDVRE